VLAVTDNWSLNGDDRIFRSCVPRVISDKKAHSLAFIGRSTLQLRQIIAVVRYANLRASNAIALGWIVASKLERLSLFGRDRGLRVVSTRKRDEEIASARHGS